MVNHGVISEPNSPVRKALRRAIELCRETIDRLQEQAPELSDQKFASTLLLAASAFETALDPPAGLASETSLMIAATLGHEAAAVIRGHGLDEDLLRCAAACERAAMLCDEVTGRNR